jgi:heme-degrading monooxygenase HmoA
MPYSIIRLKIKPGQNEAFERAFIDAGMLSRPRTIDPLFEGKLMRCASDASVYCVIATWSAPERYAEWQAKSQEGVDPAAMVILNDTLIDPVPGKLFEVVASG